MRLLVIGGLCLALTACGGPLKLLTGGGPKVLANGQAGRTNTQTVGQTKIQDQRIETATAETITQEAGDNSVRAQKVDRVVVNHTPIWLVIAAIIGWVLPSPSELSRRFWRRLGFEND